MDSIYFIAFLLTLFHITHACNETLTAFNGSIRSPGYPSGYPNNLYCEWSIIGPNLNSRIQLTISTIKLENPQGDTNSCFDYIKIVDLKENNRPNAAQGLFCGTYSDQTISSSTRIMKIVFKSDGSVNKEGFYASYSISNRATTTTSTTTTTTTTTTEAPTTTEATTKRPCSLAEFTCPNSDCLGDYQICDGTDDCGDLADENCWRAPWNAKNKATMLEKSNNWLAQQVKNDWGWDKQTHRAIIAQALSDKDLKLFQSNSLNDNIIHSKHLEVEISTTLLRNEPINSDQLALYIIALQAICVDAQSYHGFNLTHKLLEDDSFHTLNPLIPLAICLSNLDIPEEFLEELEEIMNQQMDIPFKIDHMAYKVLIYSCAQRREQVLSKFFTQNITHIVETLKSTQLEDGTFGNLITTGLVAQALLSIRDAGHNWDYFKLLTRINAVQDNNGGFTDLLSTYLLMPVIAGRSLVDILDINCPLSTRARRQMVSSTTYRVMYSLWVGENREDSSSISLTIPSNSPASFFDIIKMASYQDPKFLATWKEYTWGPSIFSINNIFNHPDEQKYWRLFKIDHDHILQRYHQRLDRVYPKDKEHYVMWYTNKFQ